MQKLIKNILFLFNFNKKLFYVEKKIFKLYYISIYFKFNELLIFYQ
jgi:hypothetical protein